MLGVFALVRRLPERQPLRRASAEAMAKVDWVSGVAVLLVAVLTRTPWVPLERIDTTNGVVSGYVLGVDSGYLNVLTEERRFVILVNADVLSRE